MIRILKKRKQEIQNEINNNNILFDYINETIKQIQTKYKYYPLNDYIIQLNNLKSNIRIYSLKVLKIFYKTKNIINLNILRTSAKATTDKIKSFLILLDNINKYDKIIFDKKNEFNKHYNLRINSLSPITQQQKKLMEQIKQDYIDLDDTLEYVQKIAKFNNKLDDRKFNIISDKLNFIQKELEIITLKEQEVFSSVSE